MTKPDLILGVPDYHGDGWVYSQRDADGSLRYDPAKHAAERARDGLSTYDWWNFDQYIAEVVARAALRFAMSGVGYFEEMGEEGTKKYFIGIADPLMRYAEDKLDGLDPAAQQKVHDEAKAAMMRFAEHFPRWWD